VIFSVGCQWIERERRYGMISGTYDTSHNASMHAA